MRRFVIAAIGFAFLLVAHRPCRAAVDEPGKPNPVDCSERKELERYLERHGYESRAVILARDHFGGWSGYVWNGKTLDSDKQRFSNLHLDQPRVDLSKGEQLLVFVTNTNPMLFSAVQTEASLVAREDLAKLEAFVAGLAGVITGATRSAGQILAVDHPMAGASPEEAPEVPEKCKPLLGLERIQCSIGVDVAAARGAVDIPMAAVKAEAERIQLLSQRVADNEAAALALVSRIEAGGPAQPLLRMAADTPDIADIDKAFRSFADSRYDLQRATMPCTARVGLAKPAAQRWVDGFGDSASKAQLTRTYLAQLSTLLEGGTDCPERLSNDMERLARWLQDNPRVENKQPPESVKKVLETIITAFDAYERTSAQRDAVLLSAQSVGTNRLTVINSAGTFRTRLALQNSAYDGDECSLTAGVILVQRSSRTEVDQPFDKNGSETFTVGVRKGFENVALRHPPTLTAKYLVAARRDIDVDVDFGPIYTPLVDPTFGVVTRPVTSSLHAEATEKKTIEVIDENPQAGQLAVFGTFKAWRFTVLRPQIGALISVDHPGVFLGLAWAPISYFKLGGGWTWQQVTALGSGLKEGQEVTSDSELRTRQHFANDWYLSLSITIDNLPFWKKP